MRLSTKLKGALTSKPYAFTSRSWEAAGQAALDWFDPCGSNLRVEIRGVELMRILPRVNERINEEWISDKIRFSYDGLKRQRLDRTFLLGSPVSWKKGIKSLFSLLRVCPNWFGFSGKFLNLETSFLWKEVFCQGGNVFSDFRSMYLSPKGLFDKDSLLLVGVNLRVEAPILHLKVRQYLNGNVYQWGSALSWNFSYKQLGNQVSTLVSFMEGRHKLSKKNPFVIVGEEYRWLKYTSFSSSVGELSRLESGLKEKTQKGFPYFSRKKEIGIWFDNDELHSEDNLPFIYQGHHGDRNVEDALVVFPLGGPTERKESHLSWFGLVQKMDKILKRPGKAKEEQGLLLLYKKVLDTGKLTELTLSNFQSLFGKCIFFCGHSSLEQDVKKIFGWEIGDKCVSLNVMEQRKRFLLSLNFTKVYDNYLTDSITRSSPVMGLRSAYQTKKNYQ